MRKGSDVPYVGHVLGVCALVLEDGGGEDEAKVRVRSLTVLTVTVTPPRAQREPAPVKRIATFRAPSTATVSEAHRPEERGALPRTQWLGVSQAGIRASHFPHTATRPERHCARLSV